jgi:hypothetical protein
LTTRRPLVHTFRPENQDAGRLLGQRLPRLFERVPSPKSANARPG